MLKLYLNDNGKVITVWRSQNYNNDSNNGIGTFITLWYFQKIKSIVLANLYCHDVRKHMIVWRW